MATFSSNASSSSRLWSGELALDGLVLPGLALYKRCSLAPSASSSAKGKQKAAPVAPAVTALTRTTRSRASATGLPSPASTAASSLGTASLISSPQHDTLVVGGGSEPSPPVRRPGRRVSAGKPPPSTSSSASRGPLPAAAPPATTTAGPTVRRIKLTSALFPQLAARVDDPAAALTAALAGEGAQLVVDAVLPTADLDSSGVELPSVELDFAEGFELCNTGPTTEWPYDGTPAGRLHEKLETAIYDGRSQRFALIAVRPTQASSTEDSVALAVYGWGGSLETREMRLFAAVLGSEARARLWPMIGPGRSSDLVAGQESEPSGSILGDPDEELDRPRPQLGETFQANGTLDLKEAESQVDSRPKAAFVRRDPVAMRETHSGSSLAIDPPHPPSSSDDASSAANDPAPLPPRSKRPRPNDRNRPLKDRLACTSPDEAAPGGSASGSGPPGARPGVWSKPSTSRRPAKRARKADAEVLPRPKLRAPAVQLDGETEGTWETRKRVLKDVRDGGVDSWRAAVVAGCGLIERPPSPPGTADVASNIVSRNLSLLRRCTTMSLLQHDMSRSHPDWRLVHGFVVRGVKFSLRHRQAGELLKLEDVAPSVDLHVTAYLPAGLTKSPLLRAEAARLSRALDMSAPRSVTPHPAASAEDAVPMDVDVLTADGADGADVVRSAASGTVPPPPPPPPPLQPLQLLLTTTSPAVAETNSPVAADLAAGHESLLEQPLLPVPVGEAYSVSATTSPAVVEEAITPPPVAIPNIQVDAAPTLAQPVAPVAEAFEALPAISVALALRDVFSDGDSDLTSVASEDEDAAAEEEEEEFINSRPATPAPSALAAPSPSSPLSAAPSPAPVAAAPPAAAINTAPAKMTTPFRRATRSSALLNLALYSSASKVDSEAAARTSPSAASSISVATPPNGVPVQTLLLHGKTDDTSTPRRSARRVSSGSKLATVTMQPTPAAVAPTTAAVVSSLPPAVAVSPAPSVSAAPVAKPTVLPPAEDFATRRSPRRTPTAASRSLPPSPPSPVKEEEEAADLGAAFERTVGRRGEIVYLLSRRSREGTAVSACTV